MSDLPAKHPDDGSGRSQRLDRSALERVLARAAELQTGSASDPADEFTESQLIELGKEVGLSAENLRRALAEERTRPNEPDRERGLSARLFGPGRVGASRVVPGKARDVLETVNAWMERQELLRVKRQLSDRIVWEARRGFAANLRRGLNFSGRDYALASAYEVSATVIAIDESQVVVSLDADLKSYRNKVSGGAAGATLVGVALGGSMAIIGIVAALSAAPIVLAAGTGIYAGRALQARMMARAQLSLEQLLDRLERGDFGRPPTLLGAIAAAAAVLPPRRE
jgi:hypothetical protein